MIEKYEIVISKVLFLFGAFRLFCVNSQNIDLFIFLFIFFLLEISFKFISRYLITFLELIKIRTHFCI